FPQTFHIEVLIVKIVFNDPKSGDSFQKEVEKDKSAQLLGKKIGDEIPGALAGLDGYTLKITGGSTNDGTPMRFDIPGVRTTLAFLPSGPGINEKKYLEKGMRIKKRVAGQIVGERTAQINATITKAGAKSLGELGFAGKNAAKLAEKAKKSEKPAEAKKDAAVEKPDAKKADAKAEKPEAKPEPKAAEKKADTPQ
ncbi:MAG: S6e family ribosomal protein, partial [Candidatus Micrarchaeota archaeon]|nr:S6e family ribosomal protein [Candidatus Micrarchaeota archaeon]